MRCFQKNLNLYSAKADVSMEAQALRVVQS